MVPGAVHLVSRKMAQADSLAGLRSVRPGLAQANGHGQGDVEPTDHHHGAGAVVGPRVL